MNYAKLKTYLQKHPEKIRQLVKNIDGYSSGVEEYRYWKNDEDFFLQFFSNPNDAVKAAYYGDYHVGDEYVRFDGKGNLKSLSVGKHEIELEEGLDEILQALELAMPGVYTELNPEFIEQLKEDE